MPNENETPDWVSKMPNETKYWLTMDHGEGENVQEVELSRAEFIALKAHLAKLRGYAGASLLDSTLNSSSGIIVTTP